jgi:hypothetical protein
VVALAGELCLVGIKASLPRDYEHDPALHGDIISAAAREASHPVSIYGGVLTAPQLWLTLRLAFMAASRVFIA